MRIGLAYNVRPADPPPHLPEDAFEEYDSEATLVRLCSALASLGHEVVRLGAGPGFVDTLRAERPDLVFNIAEGEGGRCREAHVPALLEILSIPYVGSDPLTLCVTLDKAIAKRIVASEGFPTPRFRVCTSPSEVDDADLAYPVIVKPAYEGSSKGIRLASRAASPAEAKERVELVTASYGQDALVEEFLPGSEVTVGIVGNHPPRLVGIMEIVPRTVRPDEFVYSLEVKRDWENQVEYRCPPSVPLEIVSEVERCAAGIYRLLGCRDFARIDFRLDGRMVPHFLECNPLPGLSPGYGDLPIMAARMGIAYEDLLSDILSSALTRLGAAPS